MANTCLYGFSFSFFSSVLFHPCKYRLKLVENKYYYSANIKVAEKKRDENFNANKKLIVLLYCLVLDNILYLSNPRFKLNCFIFRTIKLHRSRSSTVQNSKGDTVRSPTCYPTLAVKKDGFNNLSVDKAL